VLIDSAHVIGEEAPAAAATTHAPVKAPAVAPPAKHSRQSASGQG
jgi:hypothetical protein